MEVCTLSSGANFEPLSASLQRGVRFFHSLLPAFPSIHLTVPLPIGQEYGLTMFRLINETGRLGSTSTPAALCPCIPYMEGNILLHTFLVQAYQLLWPVRINEA